MRFLLDESAELRIAGFLAAHDHDATRIGRDYPASLPDEAVLARSAALPCARCSRCSMR